MQIRQFMYLANERHREREKIALCAAEKPRKTYENFLLFFYMFRPSCELSEEL
jgi:hypothetical protein